MGDRAAIIGGWPTVRWKPVCGHGRVHVFMRYAAAADETSTAERQAFRGERKKALVTGAK